MEENKEIFTYTYSARQQEEVRRILQKYTPLQEDKMELLRRLDKSAQQPGTIAGIALGVCGTLMLGLGMCCTMVWTGVFALGVAVGCTGGRHRSVSIARAVTEYLNKLGYAAYENHRDITRG